MTREQLEHAIRAAGAICGDRELYIVGSQAILGAYPDAHPDLLRSIEVDVAHTGRRAGLRWDARYFAGGHSSPLERQQLCG